MGLNHECGVCPSGLNFFLLWLIGLDYKDCFRGKKKTVFLKKPILLKCPICTETSGKVY